MSIATMTKRQKKVARHTLDVVTVALVALGIWLASGIHEVKPVPTHSPVTISDTVHV
jgi:hypothetical protein